jgi:hypothetical protein
MRPVTRSVSLSAILLALVLVLPRTADAQSSKYYGFVGGATLSDFSDSYNAYSTAGKWGGNAGLILGIRTTNRMTLSIEPAWTQMGAKIGDTGGGIDYIEVPITIGGLAEGGDKLRYGGYAGITPAFKLSCSIDQPASACDHVKSTAWFLPLGLRLLTQTGKGAFVGFDIRYSLPLGSTFDDATIHQRSWAFRLVFAKGDL